MRKRTLFYLFYFFLFGMLLPAFADIDVQQVQQSILNKNLTWRAEENKFTVMTLEERQMYLGDLPRPIKPRVIDEKSGNKSEQSVFNTPASSSASFPPSLDWRTNNGNWVTPVKSQEACGSCWAFGAIAAWESRIRLAANDPNLQVNKSEQYLISCSAGGCDGWYFAGEEGAASYIFQFGCPDADCFPYGSPYDQRSCNEKCSNWIEVSDTLRAGSYLSFLAPLTAPYVESIKSALMNGPVVTRFDVYADFYSYRTGIYQYSSGDFQGGHAVAIVGWDDTTNPPCWIVKNSWGDDWGESGFFRIAQIEEMSEFAVGSYEILHGLKPNEKELHVEDVLGEWGYGSSTPGYRWAGVEYTAPTDGLLSAVVTHFRDINLDYEIRIYDGISSDGYPGTLLAQQSGSFGNTCGFKTVELNQPVAVQRNSDIFITVKYGVMAYPVPLETDKSSYNSGRSWYGGESGAFPWSRQTSYGDWKIRAILTQQNAPEMTVIYPNGGEIVACDMDIQWSSHNAGNSVMLEYYCDGSWEPIITSTPNDGSYIWSVPELQCSAAKIRVTDIASMTSDESDNYFSIQCQMVALQVLVPNVPLVWQAGESQSITWTPGFSSGTVNVYYSLNGGSSWSLIAQNIADTGCLTWTVPQTTATTCKIRVADALDSSVSDDSDAAFRIGTAAAPFLQLSDIQGKPGDQISVDLWIGGNTTPFDAFGAALQYEPAHLTFLEAQKGDLTRDWIQVTASANAPGLLTLGGFHTTALPSASSGTLMRLLFEITCTECSGCAASHLILGGFVDDAAGMNAYSGTFSLRQCPLAILVPNDKVLWQPGDTRTITWASQADGAVNLEFSADNGTTWQSIGENVKDTGCYSWSVPHLTSNTCKIRVTHSDDPSCSDICDNIFSIGAATTPAISISSISGNSGDQLVAQLYVHGNQKAIDAFGLELHYDTAHLAFVESQKGELTTDWIQVTGTENSPGTITLGGFHTSAIPVGTTGEMMRLVFDVTCNNCGDCAASHLSLMNPVDDVVNMALYSGTFSVQQCPLYVLMPSGQLYWKPGSIHPITWLTGAEEGVVMLEYSAVAQTSWTTIESDIPDNGFYQWTLPHTLPNEIHIRLADATNPACSSTSGPITTSAPQAPYLLVTDCSGSHGDVFAADIYVENGETLIDAFGLNVRFDPQHLSFVNIEKGDLTTNWTQVGGDQIQPGLITIGGFHTQPIGAGSDGALARVLFEILAPCSPFNVSYLAIENTVDDVLNFPTYVGTFSCPPPCLLGDVNNDGAITPADALCCFGMYVHGVPGAECESECSYYSADANCDGMYTPQDALIIFQHYISGEPIVCPTTLLAKNLADAVICLNTHVDAKTREIVLPVEVSNAQGLQSFGLEMIYPEQVMNFISGSPGAETANWIALDVQELEHGRLVIGGFDLQGLDKNTNTTLIELRFMPKEKIDGYGTFAIVDAKDQLATAATNVVQFNSASDLLKPEEYALLQNYPNPFNMNTDIVFHLPEQSSVKLDIYNVFGQLTKRLVDKELPAGVHRFTWNGKDENNQSISSGLYFYKIQAGSFSQIKRMIVMK